MAGCISELVSWVLYEANPLTRSPARYKASQVGAEINKVQKEIGQLKKVSNQKTLLL